MLAHKINDLDNFIAGWYIDLAICDDIINFFKNSKNKVAGTTMSGLDTNQKISTDVAFEHNAVFFSYMDQLQNVLNLYKIKYPWCDKFSQWAIAETVNVQKYAPTEGYFAWHTERTTSSYPESTRHMVFMTYLNDVSDSGETEWYHQNIKVKPEKGLTVIWPADWTFVHRGIPSPTQEKFIVTGWLNYIN